MTGLWKIFCVKEMSTRLHICVGAKVAKDAIYYIMYSLTTAVSYHLGIYLGR